MDVQLLDKSSCLLLAAWPYNSMNAQCMTVGVSLDSKKVVSIKYFTLVKWCECPIRNIV